MGAHRAAAGTPGTPPPEIPWARTGAAWPGRSEAPPRTEPPAPRRRTPRRSRSNPASRSPFPYEPSRGRLPDLATGSPRDTPAALVRDDRHGRAGCRLPTFAVVPVDTGRSDPPGHDAAHALLRTSSTAAATYGRVLPRKRGEQGRPEQRSGRVGVVPCLAGCAGALSRCVRTVCPAGVPGPDGTPALPWAR